MLRVIVIDDKITVTGLKSMFHPSRDGIKIVNSFRNTAEAIFKAKLCTFDFIIHELWAGKIQPLENIKKLKAQFPDKPILIFTRDELLEWKRKTIQIGVNGFISKGSSKSQIKAAIFGIIDNGSHFPSISSLEPSAETSGNPNPIEYSIVLLLSEGFRLREIACKSHLSIATIERMFHKLRMEHNVVNNCELVTVFIQRYFHS